MLSDAVALTGERIPDLISARWIPKKSSSENPTRTNGFVRYGATLAKLSIAVPSSQLNGIPDSRPLVRLHSKRLFFNNETVPSRNPEVAQKRSNSR